MLFYTWLHLRLWWTHDASDKLRHEFYILNSMIRWHICTLRPLIILNAMCILYPLLCNLWAFRWPNDHRKNLRDDLVTLEKIVDRIVDPYDTIEMQKSKTNILDPLWIKLQMQLELIIQNTKSGNFSIQDRIFYLDKHSMLHLSLYDSQRIYCLREAISLLATAMYSFIW